MAGNDPFLDSFEQIDEYQAEYSLLLGLISELQGKVLLFEMEDLRSIVINYGDILNFIKKHYHSYSFMVFSFVHGECTCEEIEQHAGIGFKQEELINQTLQRSTEKSTYVLCISEQTTILANNGLLDDKFRSHFTDKQLMDEVERKKFSLDQLPEAFEHYHVERVHRGCAFVDNGKINNSISEQQLRNHLYEYLRDNTKMKTHIEYCTSMKNDEESVDISLVDSNNSIAIIEVKFFVEGHLFELQNRSKYSTSRFKDGYKQLNKYCVHLSKHFPDNSLHSAFLYMFYASGKADHDIKADAKRYFGDLDEAGQFSEEFMVSYKATIYDNLLGR